MVSGNFMRPTLSILFLFFFLVSVGQNQFKIDYPSPVDTIVNFSDTLGKEIVYNIDFVNKAGQTIKNRERMIFENHQSKKGYDINDYKTYYFYKDTLLNLEVTFSFNGNYLNKTEYEYNRGKQIKATFYSYSKKLTGDTLTKLKSGDYYLNNPLEMPKKGWTSYRVDKREYDENGNITYKGYFISEGKSNKIMADREQYFIYNDNKQLIEHLSLTRKKCKDGICGTDLMQTFEYDCNGKLIRKNWYEDGRYQAFNLYKYSDTTIIEEDYFFSNPYGEYIKGKTNPYSRSNPSIIKYILNKQTGEYVDEKYNSTFIICDDAR
jgi:hypothetical protein